MRLTLFIFSVCLSFSLEAGKPQKHEFAYEIENLIFEIAELGKIVPQHCVPRMRELLTGGGFYLNGINKLINKEFLTNPAIQRDIFDALSDVSHIRTVILRNLELTEIPKKIMKLRNLKILVLSDNPITTLPSEILDLPLKSLDLTNTPLAQAEGKNIWTSEDIQAWFDAQKKLEIKRDIKFIYEALIESKKSAKKVYKLTRAQPNLTKHQHDFFLRMYLNFSHPFILRETMTRIRPLLPYEEIERLVQIYTKFQATYTFLFEQELSSDEFEKIIPKYFNFFIISQ